MPKQLDKIDGSPFGRSDIDVVEETSCYRGFLKLDRIRLRHRLFGGGWSSIINREIVRRKEAVAVLIYDPDLDAVCLVQQFRAALMDKQASPWPYELVAGLVDKEGESLEETVRREMLEECGVSPMYLEKINAYWMSVGSSDERMHLYVALAHLQNTSGHYGEESESEDIKALVVSREDANCWAFERMESNASSIIALQWLENERERLAELWQG